MKLLSLLFFLLFTLSIQTFGTDFTVNLTSDQHDASLDDNTCDVDLATAGFQCSIRAAVEQANRLITSDRILFNLPPNSVITLTEANGGQIQISTENVVDQLQIIGSGANNLTIDGGIGTNRIFFINNITNNATEISDLALTGGNGNNSFGGAISSSAGQVLLNRVYIYGNTAQFGGGVFVAEVLSVRNSTISGNFASGDGGGIAAGGSYGISVVNSTISGNSAGVNGGGVFVGEGASFTNVTITHNNSTNGGGIAYQSERTLRLRNTIIASNTTTNGIGPEIYSDGLSAGGIVSEGHNLIGDQQGDSAFTGKPITFQPTDIFDTDPKLDEVLRNNGGPTPTHALLLGSPVIDKGNNSLAVDSFGSLPLLTDQRGLQRIVDGDGNGTAIVDIGAYELQLATTAAMVIVGGRVITTDMRGITNIRLSLTDSHGNIRTVMTDLSGYYRFENIQAGEIYIISATGKHYTFSQPMQILNVNDEIEEVNFIANSEKRLRIF